MPELPEVETMRRGILPIVGCRIEDVQRTPCACKPIVVSPRIDRFRRRVQGQTIAEISRLGKRVVIRLGSSDAIILEPRMTGLILLAEPPNRKHLRLSFSLSGGTHDELLFWDRRGLGVITLLSSEQLEERLGPKRLGPDALLLTADQLREKLARSSRAIKVALLDQKVTAGIGNLYASEILHLAKIHPGTRCDRILVRQWPLLCESIQKILHEAIRHEGSTLSDATYRNALNQAGGYQNYHRVYDRAEQNCLSCGQATIRRIVQAQRSTFFCPICQSRS